MTMGVSTTTQISPLRPVCPSIFRSSRHWPCSPSMPSYRYFSISLHRFWGKRPSGALVNLQKSDEKMIIASRNFSLHPLMEVCNSTRAEWGKQTIIMKQDQRKRKLLEKKGPYVPDNGKQDGGSCLVRQGMKDTNSSNILTQDESIGRKKLFSAHTSNNNLAAFIDDVQNPSAYIQQPNGSMFSGSSKEGGWTSSSLLRTTNEEKQVQFSEHGEAGPDTIDVRLKNGVYDSARDNVTPSFKDKNILKQDLRKRKLQKKKGLYIPDKDKVDGGSCLARETMMDGYSSNILTCDKSPNITDNNRAALTDYLQTHSVYIPKPNDSRLNDNSKESGSTSSSLVHPPNGKIELHSSEHGEAGTVKVAFHLKDGNFATVTDNEKPTSDEENHMRKKLTSIYGSVLVVDSVSMAKQVVSKLTNQYRHLIHACDTEVAKIDVKKETPIDHGEIICFSIYCGPEADFGHGKSCIWVDVLDGGNSDVLVEFAPFFEDPSIKKVWHNYSFDNHVIENYGISVSGFHADTMHMARLWDSSRRLEGGYSLEALTGDQKVMNRAQSCYKELIGKVSMKAIFGKKKVKKDGSEGKIITIAPVEELQREEREPWICYSALDAISTLQLYESLSRKLSQMEWKFNGELVPGKSMLDFYQEHWRPFGKLLVRMEREGMLVDRAYLAKLEKVAKAEQRVAANRFRTWASKYCSDAKYMNVGSDTQLRQLLFGGDRNSKDPALPLPDKKQFKILNVDKVIEKGKKAPMKYRTIELHSIGVSLPVEMYTATGWPSVSGDALKTLAGKISEQYGVAELQLDGALVNESEAMTDEDSDTKEPSTDADRETPATETKSEQFQTTEDGIEACHAIASLCEVCTIDSLISNFILPLQGSNVSGKTGRVHCSLNINTETGRLSARRPNLQNQPALEKDRYKIRQAFIAAPGNSLIVADYGQLELRILAHLANCKSMLDAFEAGGDFHSRTALNMYQHIREAIEKKQVLLEWYPQPGEDKPPVPLLKDAFASERRKAKMLNFSIAYGKTPVGLARDWKVSVKEAKRTVDLWYKERKEVLAWQDKRKEEARSKGCVHTLLGRARRFPSMTHASYSQRGHIERAAINTPVQGSAADVAMCAMLEISKNIRLKELGWKLLLQVHDEVILEGPNESAQIAKAIVVECMSKPFGGRNILKVDLAVDAKCAQNWYSAK